MKTTRFFLAVATAAVMVACSQSDDLSVQSQAVQQGETAVGFSTYMPRATRAGAVGEITTVEDLQIDNFGVFAYYTEKTDFKTDGANTTVAPNFMWNQKVDFDGDNWFYTPVKYWPNESSATAVDAADPSGNDAQNGGAKAPDKVTFFAYAPYVEANAANGSVSPNTDGITAIKTLNSQTKDPIIAYTTAKDPLKTVDLLWGVVPAFKTKYSTVNGESAALEAGRPNYNLVKQTAQEKIMFQFKHALSKLTLDVVGFFDEVPEHGANAGFGDVSHNNVAKDTKIVIEYVKLKTDKYALSGELNLNNQTADAAEWGTLGETRLNFEINNSQLTNLIRYRTPSDIKKGYAEQPRGVTNEPIALLANDASQEAFYGIIPEIKEAGKFWSVEVKYHVFTKDANLENGYSEITNVIKKDDIDMTLLQGKHYNLRLRLGMTTVKFEATVEDWVDNAGTPADLPINVEVASVDAYTVTPAAAGGVSTDALATAASQGETLNLSNVPYTLTVSDVEATLLHGTSAAVDVKATTFKTDVDWIKVAANGTINVDENLTAAERTGKIWVTYGGKDGQAITVKQHGSILSVDLKVAGGTSVTDAAWNNDNNQYAYTLVIKYADSADADVYNSVEGEEADLGCAESWITIDKANNKLIVNSKNESETADRTATITATYDGVSSSVTITQLGHFEHP